MIEYNSSEMILHSSIIGSVEIYSLETFKMKRKLDERISLVNYDKKSDSLIILKKEVFRTSDWVCNSIYTCNYQNFDCKIRHDFGRVCRKPTAIPNSDLIVTQSRGFKISLWNVRTGALEALIPFDKEAMILDFPFAIEKDYLIARYYETLYVFDWKKRQLMQTYTTATSNKGENHIIIPNTNIVLMNTWKDVHLLNYINGTTKKIFKYDDSIIDLTYDEETQLLLVAYANKIEAVNYTTCYSYMA